MSNHTSNELAFAYPLLLDVRQKLIVIVGGGAVAGRKARGLLAAGATRLRVVSPALAADFPQPVEWTAEEYSPRHLASASLVFAATNCATINQRVMQDAAAIGALATRADAEIPIDDGSAGDEFRAGDFATPAIYRSGPLTISVATGGSPALAVKIRDLIADDLDPRWGELAAALRQLRPWLKSLPGLDAARRRQLFQSLLWPTALELLATGGIEALRHWLLEQVTAKS